MTRQESYALAAILSLLLLGTLVKSIQKRTFLFDSNIYAESDSLFAVATQKMNQKAPAQDSLAIKDPTHFDGDSLKHVKQSLFVSSTININTATQKELEKLPRIGPAMAQRIIEYRATMGPFEKTEDLINVKGIGPKTFEQLKEKVSLR